MRVFVLVALVCAVAIGGCGKKEELHKLSTTMLVAGQGTAAKTQMRNVIPSKPAPQRLSVVIEEERYLGDVARQLGSSVDAMLALNKLTDTLLQRGQILLVDTSREMVEKFVDKRERRKAAKLAAEEAKRQEKLRKEAEVRAAKRQKLLEARAKKRGIKIAAAGTAPDRGPSAVPLRSGETRQVGHGQVRGVTMPTSFGGPSP